MEISQALKEQIFPYLSGNETIIWASKPKKSFIYIPSDIFSIVIGIFWILFSAFWLALTIGPALDGEQGSAQALPYVSIAFFIVGIWFIIIKNIMRATKRRHLVYVITSKRVLAIYSNSEYYEQYQLSDICYAEVKKDNDDVGSVYFFFEKNTTKKYSNIGIFAVSDIDNVSKIIFKKVRNKK